MTPVLTGLVLLAALLHASWNAMLKSGGNRAWSMTVMQLATLAVSGAAAPFVPLPAPASWPWLIGGVLLHIGYRVSLVRAFGHGELGEIYPISRGASPMMVTAGAFAVAGDRPGLAVLCGIVLNSAGIIGLRRGSGRPLPTVAFGAALLTAAFTAGYTVVDGTGARLSGSPIAFVVWLFLLGGIGSLVWWWMNPTRGPHPLPDTIRAAVGGAVSVLAYGMVIVASALGAMGAVSALRETSVVFAVLIARAFMGEALGVRRLVSCVVVATGCACIAL